MWHLATLKNQDYYFFASDRRIFNQLSIGFIFRWLITSSVDLCAARVLFLSVIFFFAQRRFLVRRIFCYFQNLQLIGEKKKENNNSRMIGREILFSFVCSSRVSRECRVISDLCFFFEFVSFATPWSCHLWSGKHKLLFHSRQVADLDSTSRHSTHEWHRRQGELLKRILQKVFF